MRSATIENKKMVNEHQNIDLSIRTISNGAYTTLKWIAIITMMFHHTAHLLYYFSLISATDYLACKTIGVLAFPIFCFLLVECYYHTQNKPRHFIRIFILALISEIPWDIFVNGSLIETTFQNVCFTLALGFLMLWTMDIPFEKMVKIVRPKTNENGRLVRILVGAIRFDLIGIFALFAFILKSDFSWYGILLIGLFRLAHVRKHRIAWVITGIATFVLIRLPYDITSLFAFAAIPIIGLAISSTNSKKCKGIISLDFLQLKAFQIIARFFYPAHLILFALITYFFSI